MVQTPIKILIVDDESLIREIISDYLEDSGYETMTVPDAETALSLLTEINPALILLDLQMPGKGGLWLLKELAQAQIHIPVVVVSGAGDIGFVVESLRNGAWDYITKPIKDMAILDHTINSALEKQRLLEENNNHRLHLEQLVKERTDELQLSETRYQKLFSTMMNGFAIFKILSKTPNFIRDLINIDANPAFLKMLQLSTLDLANKSFFELFPSLEKTLPARFQSLTNEDQAVHYVEYVAELKKHFEIYAYTLDAFTLALFISDVTPRIKAESGLLKSLKEKELLLKEMHHRVKNNLQVIYGLITLQLMEIDEPQIKRMLKEHQDRIMSMALIHKNLYLYNDIQHVQMQEYLPQLLSSSLQSYGIDPKDVRMDFQINAFSFHLDFAIPCGLLLNEILSFILQHWEAKHNSLQIILEKTNGDYTLKLFTPLRLKDLFSREEGFSKTILSMLTSQLNGELDIFEDSLKTTFQLTFPEQEVVQFS